MKTKAALARVFPGLALSMFRPNKDGDEPTYEVVGKWVHITPFFGGEWDVWFCNTGGMAEGMGARRLNNLLAQIPPGIKPSVCDGEAWWSTEDKAVVQAFVEANRVQLGLKKRRSATAGRFKPKAPV